MSNDVTKNPSGVQVVCSVGEAMVVLDEADKAGIIRLEDQPKLAALRGRIAMGLLTDKGAQEEMHRLLAAGPAPAKALDAIAAHFQPGDVIGLKFISPDRSGAVVFNGRLDTPEERAAMEAEIAENIALRGCYFGVNPRQAKMADNPLQDAKASDIAARRTVFLDLDNKDAPDDDPGWTRTIAELKTLGPLSVFKSGNGWHVYFPIETVEGAALGISAEALAAVFAQIGADNVGDLPRVARLPFTVNLPTAGKRKQTAAVPRLAAPEALTQQTCAPRSLVEVGANLSGMATRLGLQGKPKGTASLPGPAAHIGANGEDKTPWAAPSADLLRLALSELPNKSGGAFDSRDDWAAFGHAVKGAAVAGGFEAEGKDAFESWSDEWGGDPDEPRRFWDSCAPSSGWGAIMRTLERVNPAGAVRVKDAAAKAAFAQQAAHNVAALSASAIQAVQPFVPGQIVPRQWLYARSTIRGFFTVLTAPGGAGKSALIMVEALAMVTGRELLSGDKPHRPLTVWYHNAEDSGDEGQRRLAAAMMQHKVDHAEIAGRLFLTSGRDYAVRLARMGKDGPELVPGTGEWILATARQMGADVVIFDPISAMHGLPENSNEAINLLAGGLRQLAHEAGLGVVLLHHTGKVAASDMGAAGAAASRGASALTDAARVVRQIARPSAKEAPNLGIAENERWRYLRIDNGKANLSRIENAHWVKLVSVKLGNITPEYPSGDEVQTVERWTPPGAQSGTASDLALVQAAIASASMPPRASPKATEWVGWIVGDIVGLDGGGPGLLAGDRTLEQAADFIRIRQMLDGWVKDGGLVEVDGRDPETRKSVPCIGVGVPAFVTDPAPESAEE